MKKPVTLRPKQQLSKTEYDRQWETTRASSTQRGYDARWRKARAVFLAANPLCKMCGDEGRIEAATVVDHIVPHRGDQALFWDIGNWQPLCSFCHNRHKHSQEMRGK